jgi:hypothetical protein
MTNKQVAAMLADTLTCEQDEVSLAADFACHIKALAAEREELLKALKDLHDRVHSDICGSTCCRECSDACEIRRERE